MQLTSPISSENLMQSRLVNLVYSQCMAVHCFFRSVCGNSNHLMRIRPSGVQFMRDNPERCPG